MIHINLSFYQIISNDLKLLNHPIGHQIMRKYQQISKYP